MARHRELEALPFQLEHCPNVFAHRRELNRQFFAINKDLKKRFLVPNGSKLCNYLQNGVLSLKNPNSIARIQPAQAGSEYLQELILVA